MPDRLDAAEVETQEAFARGDIVDTMKGNNNVETDDEKGGEIQEKLRRVLLDRSSNYKVKPGQRLSILHFGFFPLTIVRALCMDSYSRLGRSDR